MKDNCGGRAKPSKQVTRLGELSCTGMSLGMAHTGPPLPKPIPESATLPTGTPFFKAMCPSTEKMAKPAKKLVQQLPMAMTKVSLPGRASQPHVHGAGVDPGAPRQVHTFPLTPFSPPSFGCAPPAHVPQRLPQAHRMMLLSNLL